MTNQAKILFICGSLNQTTMMHEISKHLKGYECYFTPFYCDGILEVLRKINLLDFTILGGRFKEQTLNYLKDNNLTIDYKGENNFYDLVFTCSDLIIPKNIRKYKIVLVQEGMTDPENFMYYLVRYLKLPRYLAGTSMNGLSNLYNKFCVASEGYKNFFTKKGANAEKIIVTGIPNFDNVKKHIENNFPFKNYVLVATSDTRETFKYENRKSFIQKALKIANGRKVIFKLHPNENFDRATKEIKKFAPSALVFTEGNIGEMIANCEVLITKYSSVVYLGLALGKEVHTDFNLEEIKKLVPNQNGGTSARRIAEVGTDLLGPIRNYVTEEFELVVLET